MAKAKHRSTVRTVRKKLGLNQAEFADLVGISFHLIHSIELRRARLTWNTAQKIAAATGVSVDWLLGGAPMHPIKAETGEPWRLKHFRKSQATPFEISTSEDFARRIQKDCIELIQICGTALKLGRLAELRYDFSRFKKSLRRAYGLDEGSVDRRHLNTPQRAMIALKLAQMEPGNKSGSLQDADDSLAAWEEEFEKDRFNRPFACHSGGHLNAKLGRYLSKDIPTPDGNQIPATII